MNIIKVIEVIEKINNNINVVNKAFNERYIHHYFSHELQKKIGEINIDRFDQNIIHPEWPTYKKSTNIENGKYKKDITNKYQPNDAGTAGFIDFVIGKYSEPEIAIEFSLKYGWNHEEVVYDFLKMLDKRNKFKIGCSYNIILREKTKLVAGNKLNDLEEHITRALVEAKERLANNIAKLDKRLPCFIVSEIDFHSDRRIWFYDFNEEVFKLIDNFENIKEKFR